MIYVPSPARVERAQKLTENISLLRIKSSMEHMPGQFVQASVLGIGECPISICSYSPRFIELCVRAVGNVTNALCSLKRGDALFVRGPYGRGYPMKEVEGKELLLIGGGTGAAPLRSVVEYYYRHRKRYPALRVFAGFKSPEDIIFKDEFKKWKKELSSCLVSVDKPAKGWRGEIGAVTCLLGKAKINKESAAFVCGPPVMVKFVAERLNSAGVPDSSIFVSMERLMYCGVGKCGHCMVNGKFVCKDGPVFRLSEVKGLPEMQ